MRLSLNEWRRQILYFKRKNFHNLQKVRGIVNTIAFFIVWGYAGYYIANKADRTTQETGIHHSVQVAKLIGIKHITKYNPITGETEQIEVDRVLAEKESEARQKILEERRLREEARLTQSSQNSNI